jgi:hypothetical protein
MNDHLKAHRFYLISDDPIAYLTGNREDGDSFAIEMTQSRPGFWFADVSLPEGTYHTRFYSGNKDHIVYCGPGVTDGSWQNGLDAIVVVRESLSEDAMSNKSRDKAIEAEFLRYGRRLLDIAVDSQRLLASLGHSPADPPCQSAQRDAIDLLPTQERIQFHHEQHKA